MRTRTFVTAAAALILSGATLVACGDKDTPANSMMESTMPSESSSSSMDKMDKDAMEKMEKDAMEKDAMEKK
ncbi:MAG: hypothetical protein Q4A31_12290 [Corynebacterium sp.]|uniref:hypothetical protein n=1 Tax=Corynebacterium sp. TaxID=1720 RepID=UPI0026DBDF93|nr:hypothetical protein [Corynebacterium sp.]MDO4762691.1 hypothetical protein [Corynebacterium sp.]